VTGSLVGCTYVVLGYSLMILANGYGSES